MSKIFTLNFRQSILDFLVDYIITNYINHNIDLRNLAVIFGGRRPQIYLKKRLAQKIGKSFFPPNFFSMDDFVEYIVSKRKSFSKISNLDAAFLVYKITKEMFPSILSGRETFVKFLPWATEILNFIEQLDLEAIEEVKLDKIQAAARIGYDIPQTINTLLENIIVVRKEFHKLLEANSSLTRGLIYLNAANSLEGLNFDDFKEIIFAGVFYLHATEKRILKYLYGKEKTCIIFQGDERDFSILAENSKLFNTKIISEDNNIKNENIHFYSAFDSHSQVSTAKEIISEIENKNGTVIVLLDEKKVVPLISEISTVLEDFNVSLGVPIYKSTLYTLIHQVIKLQLTKKDKKYHSKSYLNLISHPFTKNLGLDNSELIIPLITKTIKKFLTGVYKSSISGSAFIDLVEVEDLDSIYESVLIDLGLNGCKMGIDTIKSYLNKLHEIFIKSFEEINSFKELCNAIVCILEIISKNSNKHLDKYLLNYKAVENIYDLVNQIQSTSFYELKFSKEDVFKIFNFLLEDQRISFSGSPLKGLQVLGLLETRSLDFENVIMLDVNESVLPNVRVSEPLIPTDVMMALGINRARKEEEIQKYYFLRLINGARKSYLIFEESSDKEKSRFIEEIIWSKEKNLGQQGSFLATSYFYNIKTFQKNLSVNKNEDIIRYLKNFTYSSSSLDTYLNCPLKFYYSYVLKLVEKDNLLDETENVDVGNFLHNFLKDFFISWKGKKPNYDESFKEIFLSRLDKEFDTAFKNKMQTEAYLLKEIVSTRLEMFIKKEREREFVKILEIEKPLRFPFSLNNLTFELKGKIDRIDQIDSNTVLIIDYKTGENKMMIKNTKRLSKDDLSRLSIKKNVKSFQLPLYILFCEKFYNDFSVNAALYNLRDAQLTFFFNEKNNDKDTRKEILSYIKNSIEKILDEILDIKMPFVADDSDAGYCQFCSFKNLCR